MTGKLLTPITVAEQLNVSTKVVMRLLRSGQLEGSKVGRQWRVQPIAIDRYVARRRFQPSPSPQMTTRSTHRTPRMSHESELNLPGAGEFL